MEDNNNNAGSQPENKPFSFSGKAGEFFVIWIVNVALTILTLGIYSAWAKVRTNQYFYGNTFLDGVSFRYTAKPMQILKGRIIAFVLFIAYYFSSTLSPFLALGIFVLIMLLVPALLVMSMSFRLRNTVYRNVHFDFDKNYKRAYFVFAVPVIVSGLYIFLISQQPHFINQESPQQAMTYLMVIGLTVVAIAIMFPWWEYMITRFKVDHARYGSSPFTFQTGLKQYYLLYLKVFALFVLLFAVYAVFMFMIQTVAGEAAALFMPVFMLIMMLVYLWIFAFIQAMRTNLVFNNIELVGNRTRSQMKAGYLFYLYITNTLAIALTLGLMTPWAKIRTARYRLSVTSIDMITDMGQFTASEAQKQSAIGEEIGDMFDMDLGF